MCILFLDSKKHLDYKTTHTEKFFDHSYMYKYIAYSNPQPANPVSPLNLLK